MKTALVTGVAGQDGSYMAELLLSKGYRVIGAVKSSELAIRKLPPTLTGAVELVDWNMADQGQMNDVVRAHQPDEIYNFAAHSSGEGMYDDPLQVAEINGLAVVRVLEAIRDVDISIRFCQASSREIFGDASEAPQDEETRPNPRSPYGAAKLYADMMIGIYRKRYGLYACSAILYNHESPRRGIQFVSRKVVHEAVKIKNGESESLKLGNLDTRRDWGYAVDYVRAMWLMLQQKYPDDFVIASGKTHTVRELCELTFRYLDLDYRDYVTFEDGAYRPSESTELVGCTKKAEIILGWRPTMSFAELIKTMVDAEVATNRNRLMS